MSPRKPHIRAFTLGDFMTNSFVVTAPDTSGQAADCWIVDCGFEPEPMFRYIDAEGLKPAALLLTHAHADHIAGVDELLGRYGRLPVYLHEAERGFCSDPTLNLSAMMGMHVTCAEPDHWLTDGDTLQFGGATWRVVHAPGHSPGCVLFIHDDSSQAIVGDTLFMGSIGRIDFPTSNVDDMRKTIRETMMSLPDDMTIHPGHGPHTTIGAERATNPFVVHGF